LPEAISKKDIFEYARMTYGISRKIDGSVLIFLSPSKTQSISPSRKWASALKTGPFFEDAGVIAGMLADRPMEYFVQREKISPEKAERLSRIWAEWDSSPMLSAAELYRGPAFTALDQTSLDEAVLLAGQGPALGVLSALYGLSMAYELIHPYRLDFKYSDLEIRGKSLLNHWQRRIAERLGGEPWKLFIDLSSKEFSPLIPRGNAAILRIDFREWRRSAWRTVSATAKQLRGAMARHILSSPGMNLGDLRSSTVAGYSLNPDLSSHDEWIFTPSGALD
jgi:cytoplasmic iron level regulating protein YaaA (DUF328/UPF0246 family)